MLCWPNGELRRIAHKVLQNLYGPAVGFTKFAQLSSHNVNAKETLTDSDKKCDFKNGIDSYAMKSVDYLNLYINGRIGSSYIGNHGVNTSGINKLQA